MKRILAALFLFLPTIAVAQQYQVVPGQSVIGRNSTVAGPSQAIPFATLTDDLFQKKASNQVFASPTSGSSDFPAFRALVGADLPVPSATTLGGVESLTCSSSNWFHTLSTGGVFGCSQPAFSDISGTLAAASQLSGQVPIANGGTGAATQSAAAIAVLPTATRSGDVLYWDGSAWNHLAGNNSATQLFLQESTSGVPTWASASGSVTLTAQPGGRLTLTSGTPITTTDVVGATVVYYAPLNSEYVPIYNGTAQQRYQFTASTTDTVGLSVTLGANWASGSAYDWFIALNSGTPVLCSGPAWSSAVAGTSSRGSGAGTTQLALYDGLWTNAVSITCRTSNTATITVPANEGTYVGSSLMTGAGATEDSAAKRYLFNLYNQTLRKLKSSTETTASWTYAATTWRQANGNASNQFALFEGMPGTLLDAEVNGAGNSSPLNFMAVAIGIDSTNTDSCDQHFLSTAANDVTLSCTLKTYPTLGLHDYAWLEAVGVSGGTNTFIGQQVNNGIISQQSGIVGSILD